MKYKYFIRNLKIKKLVPRVIPWHESQIDIILTLEKLKKLNLIDKSWEYYGFDGDIHPSFEEGGFFYNGKDFITIFSSYGDSKHFLHDDNNYINFFNTQSKYNFWLNFMHRDRDIIQISINVNLDPEEEEEFNKPLLNMYFKNLNYLEEENFNKEFIIETFINYNKKIDEHKRWEINKIFLKYNEKKMDNLLKIYRELGIEKKIELELLVYIIKYLLRNNVKKNYKEIKKEIKINLKRFLEGWRIGYIKEKCIIKDDFTEDIYKFIYLVCNDYIKIIKKEKKIEKIYMEYNKNYWIDLPIEEEIWRKYKDDFKDDYWKLYDEKEEIKYFLIKNNSFSDVNTEYSEQFINSTHIRMAKYFTLFKNNNNFKELFNLNTLLQYKKIILILREIREINEQIEKKYYKHFNLPIEYKYKKIKERSPEAEEFIKVFINNQIRKNLTKE
jgi:hypothetical protein